MNERQTGQTLLSMLNSRGGVESEYTDEVLGTVHSTNPLAIWVSQDLLIPSNFIELTNEAKGVSVNVNLAINAKTEEGKKVTGNASGSVTVFQPLNQGDKVRMLRVQKGQRYIVLGRV